MTSKTILATIAIAFLAGTITTSLASATTASGTPFDQLRAAIQDLQNQINNIQLTPGPQGPPGPKGDTGDAGQGVTTISLAPGDLNCPNGGTRLTSASGTTYACNGSDGAPGSPGPSGTSNIVTYIASGSSDCPSNFFCAAQANCNPGDVALGGGFTAPQIGRFFQVHFDGPVGLPEANGWAVEVFNTHTDTIPLTAKAICMDKTP